MDGLVEGDILKVSFACVAAFKKWTRQGSRSLQLITCSRGNLSRGCRLMSLGPWKLISRVGDVLKTTVQHGDILLWLLCPVACGTRLDG